MTTIVSSIGLKGLEGYHVRVQVRISIGKESMVIVGLPDASVKESRERVLAAFGYFWEAMTLRRWGLHKQQSVTRET